MHFVQGSNALRAYFGTGRLEDLEQARGKFAEAENEDPAFALASFYVALADNELRDSDAAIDRLTALTSRPIEFLPQAYLQLAYAHTKKYEDRHYFEAGRALDEARKQAEARRKRDLLPLIEAYRVFLYAVMGGRLREGDRSSYLDQAIALGHRLLKDRAIARLPERNQILFEIHNALGVAYMRKGQLEEPFSAEQNRLWDQAREHYKAALEHNPAAARTLQNQGTLLMMEGDLYYERNFEEARQRYLRALALYESSLKLNFRDQFVHYRIAELNARLGDWDRASLFLHSGVDQPGSVSRVSWDRLYRAIQAENPSPLLFHY